MAPKIPDIQAIDAMRRGCRITLHNQCSLPLHITAYRFELPVHYRYRPGETLWQPFARNLSCDLHCLVFAFEIYDGDVYYYELYTDGNLADEYSSDIDYFGTITDGSVVLKDDDFLLRTDHAAILCSAFGTEDAVSEVTHILNSPDWRGEPDDRHRSVTRALGLHEHAQYVGLGPVSGNWQIPGFTTIFK